MLTTLPPAKLMDFATDCVDDPLRFVTLAFPWGDPGTILAGHDGPDTWQSALLEAIGSHLSAHKDSLRMGVASGHGIGKAQPLDMVIDTPTGPRRFGDLQYGSLVFGQSGQPTAVLGVFPQGTRQVYRVTFDDQTSTLACAEHLWTVRGRQERRKGEPWVTLTTADLLSRGVKRSNGLTEARQWEIPTVLPLQYPYKWVPIEPYTLGYWLGDGSSNTALVTTMDPEPIARIKQAGYTVTEAQWSKLTGSQARVFTIGGLGRPLRDLGLFTCRSGERFVPDMYKYNLPEVRHAVLSGLLDSDGFVDKDGKPIYTTVSEQLAADVAWLVRSLGGKARVGKAKRTGYQPAYNVTFAMPDGPGLFTIPRKAERYRPTSQTRYVTRFLDRIEPVGETECQCIAVAAPDQLYVCNDAIVTHNTALSAWLILWFMATRPHPQVVVTANTGVQLASKTWRELAKWLQLSIYASTFTWTATRCYHNQAQSTWFAAAIPWRADRPEAFAGTHEQHILLLMDEASSIDDIIWETAEGMMTTAGSLWVAFGNPTRASGRFKEAFPGGRFAHRWHTFKVDSRQAKMADQAQIAQWITDYGEDSDFVRVRVRGEFPRVAVGQFISEEDIKNAEERSAVVDPLQPTIIGVDVARYGDDRSVILVRQGGLILECKIYREIDTVRLAGYVCECVDKYRDEQPTVCIDGVGLGAGVVDVCRARNYRVEEIIAGAKPMDPLHFENCRSESWGRMREWLRTRASLDPGAAYHQELRADLLGLEYAFNDKGQMQLERKQHMKDRGLASPDLGDALALTCAVSVAPKNQDKMLFTHVPTLQGLPPGLGWMAA